MAKPERGLGGKLEDVRALIGDVYGHDLHAKRVAALAGATLGVMTDALDTSYFLGRETLIPSPVAPMTRWQERLFILLSRNAVSATDFFRIPTDQVVELGAQVPI